MNSSSLLNSIIEKTNERLAEERSVVSDTTMQELARAKVQEDMNFRGLTFPLEKALHEDRLSLICEVAHATLSHEDASSTFPYTTIASDYANAGAAALSCPTEPTWFMGSNVQLREIAQTVSIPVIRKDVIIDLRMIYESKVLGASAVLLMCQVLNDTDLATYIALSHDLGMSAVVEVENEHDVERAVYSGARIVAINNRNYQTFDSDLWHTIRLRKHIPEHMLVIAAGGIETPNDIEKMTKLHVDGVLLDDALVRSANKKLTFQVFQEAAIRASEEVKIHDAEAAADEASENAERFNPAIARNRRAALHALFVQARHPIPGAPHPSCLVAYGAKDATDITAINLAKPELCTFVMDTPENPNSVSASTLTALVSRLDEAAFAIGVFSNTPEELVAALANEGIIDAIQISGDVAYKDLAENTAKHAGANHVNGKHCDAETERRLTEETEKHRISEAYLVKLRSLTEAPIIQTFTINSASDIELAQSSSANIMMLHFDKLMSASFDWNNLKQINRPYLLSLEDAKTETLIKAARVIHPWALCADVHNLREGDSDYTTLENLAHAIRQTTTR